MKRLPARHKRNVRGFSLVEVLISMSIMSILMGMVFAVLITTQKQTAGASVRLDDIDQARMAIDVLSRTLRTAIEPAQLQVYCTACSGSASTSTAVTDARTNTLTLYSNTDMVAGPNQVTFTVAYDSTLKLNTLVRTSQPPDAGTAPNYQYTACTPGPGCSMTSQILVRGVVMPTATDPSVFEYFDSASQPLVPPVASTLNLHDLFSIDAVGINLKVNTPNNLKAGPTSVYVRVGLPNSGTGVLATPPPTP